MTDNILVIKLGALGDFIQSLGPMAAIRQFHPDATITLLTTHPFVDLAKKSNYIDHIIIDERPKIYQPFKLLALRNKLNGGNFSRVYDLQNNDRTGFYFKLFSPTPEWVGIAKGASHRNTSPQRTAGLAFYGHAQTLSLAGINDVQIDQMDWIKGAIERFNLPAAYALIIAGSAANRPEKRWPATYYGSLCQKLYQHGLTPVLIGTKNEQDVLHKIKQACPQAIDLCGQTTLDDLPALARQAQLAVGNDTGPMHMIGPTGCHCFVLFSGNSKPHRHAPLGDHVKTIKRDNLDDLKPETVFSLLPL